MADAQEKFCIQLERATLEHNVKLQLMESEHEAKSAQLNVEVPLAHRRVPTAGSTQQRMKVRPF